jgi:predicted  nucleic acid-binding Zn-ribbon protein
MKNLMEDLLVLQQLELQINRDSPEAKQRRSALRQKLPETLLSKFDRWLARGRKAVAVVHNGVCSECHIQLAIGVVGALAFGDEVQHCGNCGRFLYLAEDALVFPEKAEANAKPARYRKEAPADVR